MSLKSRRGNTLIEFTLVGIPLMLISTTVMVAGISMWEFYNLAYGTQTTARYVAMHGRSCVQDGTSCALSVGNVASFFASHTLALDPSQTNVTLKSATATITCNPVSSCNSNTNQFPNANDNGLNFDVTVTAFYTITNPGRMLLPAAAAGPATFNLFATSRQRIVY